jgi:hypothetical protein
MLSSSDNLAAANAKDQEIVARARFDQKYFALLENFESYENRK